MGKRHQKNGLVYRHSQVPTKTDKNKWEIVVRKPSKKKRSTTSSYFIKNSEVDDVFVQFFHRRPPESI